jgi:hypothetical protein
VKHHLQYQTEVGKQLRDLVATLNAAVRASPAMSVAAPVVDNACDHLSAIARMHEANAELAAEKVG